MRDQTPWTAKREMPSPAAERCWEWAVEGYARFVEVPIGSKKRAIADAHQKLVELGATRASLYRTDVGAGEIRRFSGYIYPDEAVLRKPS